MDTCKACHSENVTVIRGPETISYKGSSLSVDLESSVCADCGREFISANQIKRNDELIRNAKQHATEND